MRQQQQTTGASLPWTVLLLHYQRWHVCHIPQMEASCCHLCLTVCITALEREWRTAPCRAAIAEVEAAKAVFARRKRALQQVQDVALLARQIEVQNSPARRATRQQ
jgi:hypothetical protein